MDAQKRETFILITDRTRRKNFHCRERYEISGRGKIGNREYFPLSEIPRKENGESNSDCNKSSQKEWQRARDVSLSLKKKSSLLKCHHLLRRRFTLKRGQLPKVDKKDIYMFTDSIPPQPYANKRSKQTNLLPRKDTLLFPQP